MGVVEGDENKYFEKRSEYRKDAKSFVKKKVVKFRLKTSYKGM
jgi:hypothetical protein